TFTSHFINFINKDYSRLFRTINCFLLSFIHVNHFLGFLLYKYFTCFFNRKFTLFFLRRHYLTESILHIHSHFFHTRTLEPIKRASGLFFNIYLIYLIFLFSHFKQFRDVFSFIRNSFILFLFIRIIFIFIHVRK